MPDVQWNPSVKGFMRVIDMPGDFLCEGTIG